MSIKILISNNVYLLKNFGVLLTVILLNSPSGYSSDTREAKSPTSVCQITEDSLADLMNNDNLSVIERGFAGKCLGECLSDKIMALEEKNTEVPSELISKTIAALEIARINLPDDINNEINYAFMLLRFYERQDAPLDSLKKVLRVLVKAEGLYYGSGNQIDEDLKYLTIGFLKIFNILKESKSLSDSDKKLLHDFYAENILKKKIADFYLSNHVHPGDDFVGTKSYRDATIDFIFKACFMNIPSIASYFNTVRGIQFDNLL